MNKTSGLGMIEVLVALTVASLGIAMHSALFTQFQVHHASTRNHRLAWRLAEQKFDDLKDFTQLQSSVDFDFNDIQNNSGGKQINGSTLLPAGPIDKRWTGTNTVNFNLSWQVENGYWQNNQLTYLNQTNLQASPDQKRITITVSWFEAEALKQISVQGIVAGLSPLSEILLYRPQNDSASTPPTLRQRTNSDPNSIPLTLDDLSSISTEVKQLATEKATQIRAETYDTQGHVLKQTLFLTVACQCQFAGNGYQKTTAYARWDNEEKSLIPQTGDKVIKTQGCAVDETTGQCSLQTNTLCERCCSDHHDPKNSVLDSNGHRYCDPDNGILDRCYDPFRRSTDYFNGQHVHYNKQNQIVTSGNYLESCRFRSINGSFEVYQDWHRLDMTVLPWHWLQSNLNHYQVWLKEILATVVNNCDSFWGQIHPGDSNSQIQWPDKQKSLQSLSQAWPLQSGENLLLSARGLYLDYMNAETLTAFKQMLTQNKNTIHLLPFYEFSLGEFAPYCEANHSGWCSSSASNIDVGSGFQESPNGLSPGMLLAKAYIDSDLTIRFSLKNNNFGLIPFGSAREFSGLSSVDEELNTAEFKLQIVKP